LLEKIRYERGTSLEKWCISEGRLDILQQFDYERNYPCTPKDYTKSSDAKVYFKYPCGHQCPPQRIADKTSKNTGCPLCLNRGGIGKSLADEYPEIAEMFDEEGNGISATEVSCMNGKSYWWICPRCQNPFYGKVAKVVTGSRRCGCSNKRRTNPEHYLAYYLREIDENLELDKRIDGFKFDFFLPKYSLVLEYDGYPWHNVSKNQRNDVLKDVICKNRGLKIIRLRDSRLEENLELQSVLHKFAYDEHFEFFKALPAVLEPYIGEDVKLLDIDVKRDIVKLNGFISKEEGKGNLLQHMPCLVEYIDDNEEKNNNPAYISVATHKIRLWLCHPKYPKLKWSLTAHDLFAREIPETQKIQMCLKMLEKYPEIEEQIYSVSTSIREETVFTLTCNCGASFTKNYAALIAKNRQRVSMCEECLKQSRLDNIRKYRERKRLMRKE